MKENLFKTLLVCGAALGLVAGVSGIGVALSKQVKNAQNQTNESFSANYGSSSASSTASPSDSGGSSAPVASSTTETGTPTLTLSAETLALPATNDGSMPSSTISCNVTGVKNSQVVWSISDPTKMSISKALSKTDEAITVTLAKAFYGTTTLTAMSLADSTVYKTCVVSWENPITSVFLNAVKCYYNDGYQGEVTLTSGAWVDSSCGSCTALNQAESDAVLATSVTEAKGARNVVTVTGVMYTDFVFSFKVIRPVQDSTNSHLPDVSANFYDSADSHSANTRVVFNDVHWGSTSSAWYITVKVHCSNTTGTGWEMIHFLDYYYYCIIGSK